MLAACAMLEVTQMVQNLAVRALQVGIPVFQDPLNASGAVLKRFPQAQERLPARNAQPGKQPQDCRE